MNPKNKKYYILAAVFVGLGTLVILDFSSGYVLFAKIFGPWAAIVIYPVAVAFFIPTPSRIPRGLAAGMKGGLKSFPRGLIPRGKVWGFIVLGLIFLVLALAVKTQTENPTPFQKTQPDKPIYPVVFGVVGLVTLLIAFFIPDIGSLNFIGFLLLVFGLLLCFPALINLIRRLLSYGEIKYR